ncbi:hypothetical protein H6F87_23640 [Cyanobacteria bacterium FACHB-502]|nr:hypothetical protein [Cyanobacteria bacterium FACHB-502]
MVTFFPDRLLHPIQRQLDEIGINNPKIARLICSLIPDRCPFERRIYLFGRIYDIPPLCKLNPFYRQLMGLRLRAIDYLAEIEEQQ